MFKLIAIEDVQHAGEGRMVCLHYSAGYRRPAAASALCVARGWERSEELKRLGSFCKSVAGSHRFCFSGFR
jgi:cytochrome c biogenesis protein CcdA